MTDRHFLPFLATHAGTMVDTKVVADHTDALKRFRTVSDDVEVAKRFGQFAVLDEVTRLHEESEIACSNLHLTVCERLGINAAFHASNDVLLLRFTWKHVG